MTGNTAPTEGGIDAIGELILNDTTVRGNTSRGDGGGIYNRFSATLNDSAINGNSARQNGGGIYNNIKATLNDTTVTGNTAGQNGGGIYNNPGFPPEELPGTAALKDSTVTSNAPDNCFPTSSVAGCFG